ncbi:MAG: hypothetical protein ACYC2H_01490 [Thermoplasmatota archaeon]
MAWYSSFDEKRMVFVVESVELPDGAEIDEYEIPARFEVCGNCDGKGSHVNRAIDGHGISQEEFDEDPDFREDYFAGVYDVDCDECRGARVMPIVDEVRATPQQLEIANDRIDGEADYRRECAAERRMGA